MDDFVWTFDSDIYEGDGGFQTGYGIGRCWTSVLNIFLKIEFEWLHGLQHLDFTGVCLSVLAFDGNI